MAVELPPGYHLSNFLSLIRFVRNQYDDLLMADEKDYADRFESLSQPAQSLYVRLILRKGPVFRSDKLNYSDVPDLPLVAAELAAAGYLDDQAEDDELLGLLTKTELVTCLAEPRGATRFKREELLEKISAEANPTAWPIDFAVLRPLGDQTLLLYRLLFFGNLSQDFTEFVLTDMGMLRYEPYSIGDEVRFFSQRDSLEQCWSIYALRDSCDELIETGDYEQLAEMINAEDALTAVVPDSAAAIARRRDHLLLHVARHLERQQLTEQALQIYRQANSPPARERRVRILSKSGQQQAAFKLCKQMHQDPLDESELEFAASFGQQLARKLGITTSMSRPSLTYESVAIEVDRQLAGEFGVEEAARRWFEGQGKRCFYVENNLIPGLFGLYFWDVIFKPVEGAFINPFQRGPLDLFTHSFRAARKSALAQRLDELKDRDHLQQRLQKIYEEKFGTANYFVNWNLLTPQLIDLATSLIPIEHLHAMFSRMMFDLRNNRSGFPDLVVFDDSKSVPGHYEMIEVKGPNDQLQNNQKRWIKAFSQARIPFRLAKVDWIKS